jgi:hypothetical protein
LYSPYGHCGLDRELALCWACIFQRTNKKPIRIPKRYDLPVYFLLTLQTDTQFKQRNMQKMRAEIFFEIFKHKSAEEWLKALALEIVILSTNLKKKYFLINLSYLSLIASLGLMLIAIILNYVLYADPKVI